MPQSRPGQWKPGQSGNPGGRPLAADRGTLLAQRFAGEAVDTIVAMMRSAENPAVRLAAAREVLDRAWGKPRQQAEISVRGSVHQLHLLAVQAIAAAPQDAPIPSIADLETALIGADGALAAGEDQSELDLPGGRLMPGL